MAEVQEEWGQRREIENMKGGKRNYYIREEKNVLRLRGCHKII